MKKITVLLIGLFCINILLAQEQAIKITNLNSEKEVIIKENKRIKVKTIDGRKISGRLSIENDNAILIDGQRVELTDIDGMKRNPLLVSLLTSGFLIYAGAITAGMGVIIGIFVNPTAFLLTIPAAGMIYAGIKSPNFNRTYKYVGNWIFEIITISNSVETR